MFNIFERGDLWFSKSLDLLSFQQKKRHLEFLRLIFVDIDINVRFSLLFNNGLRTLKSKFRGWNLFRSTNWNINCRDKCWKKPFCTLSNFSELLLRWVINVLYYVDNFPISTFASVKKVANLQNFNWRLIRLTKTLILPNCQLSNGFFWVQL